MVDLEFLCKHPDGVVDFSVTNHTAATRAYVAYDAAEDGFRLTDGTGAVDFSLGRTGPTSSSSRASSTSNRC